MLNNVERVCQTNIDFVEQQIKYILSLFFLNFSFGRIAQLVAGLVAHSLRKREVPGSGPRFESLAQHLTEFFFLFSV